MRRAALVIAVVSALAVLPAGVARGNHVACGDTITADTTLDSDLTNCPGDGIEIGAENITLDLNGHTIDGGGGNVGVQNFDFDSGLGYGGVTVRNGTVQQFGIGVGVLDGFGNVLRSLSVKDSGVGIRLFGAQGVLIEGNSISGNGTGIDLELARDNRILQNTITGNGTGIHTHGELVQFATYGTRILQNRILGNDGDGILLARVTGMTLVEGNVVNGNGDDGIDVDDFGEGPNRLGANSANNNGDLGIESLPSETDLGGNQAQGNGNTARCTNIACDNTGRPLFGRRLSGAAFSAMTGEAKRASVFPAYFSGTVNKVTAFLDGGGAASGSQVLRAVIYARAADGGPGALVARSFQVTVAAGAPGRWVGFYLPFPPKLQPGVYWLGLQSGQTGGVARFAWDPVAGSRSFNIDNFADGPSSTFGAAPVDNQQMSIYASG